MSHAPGRKTAFAAARVHTLHGDTAPKRDHSVVCESGRVVGIVPTTDVPPGCELLDLGDVDLAPGFVDVQVNGGGGLLLNDDPSPATIRGIVAAHRRFGTTSMLPTLITDTTAKMRAARDAVNQVLAGEDSGVVGVHFEGPFLDTRKTGAHDRSHVRAPSADDLAILKETSAGVTLVTAAACHLSADVFAQLSPAGVLVSIGHCAATYDEARAAFAGGATAVTHLFNAMSPLESRAPGVVGAALATPGVWCGLILDGVHVAFGAARAAHAAAGTGRIMLVTDAVQPVGTDMTEFELGGMRVRVEGGRCVNEEGNLAGSALDMATAVRNAVREVGLPLGDALSMASATPARFLGLEGEIGSLRPGARADLVALDGDLRCAQVVLGGELAW